MPLFRKQGAIEISINGPGNIWLQTPSGYERQSLKGFEPDPEWARRLCSYLANSNGLVFTDNSPALGCVMPGGHRFQAVLGSENVASGFAISIRVKRRTTLEAKDWGWTADRTFPAMNRAGPRNAPLSGDSATLEHILEAIRQGKAVLVSGGTGTGKTTFLNKVLMPVIPENRRVVTLEDTREVDVLQPNSVSLLVSRSREGHGLRMTYADAIDAVTRLNPDVVIPGEVSVDNAYPVVRLLNTGHSCLISTIHANNPLEAFEAFRRNIELAGHHPHGVVEFLSRAIAGIVQLSFNHETRKPGIVAIATPDQLDLGAL